MTAPPAPPVEEDEDDGWQHYKFKWRNYDIDSWCESQRAKATMLRRDAQILVTRAEQIEETMYQLKADLIPVENP